MSNSNNNIIGLSDLEVDLSRAKHGSNKIDTVKENQVLRIFRDLVKEPMILLLLVTATLYFITGNFGDGLFLTAAIFFVAAISIYQDYRSRSALAKLKILAQPNCTVIRNGTSTSIKIAEVVIGDKLVVEEGSIIAADGPIIQSNDFSVNESILTGESMSVYKDKFSPDNMVYMGTMVASGLAILDVQKIGTQTQWGQISKKLESIDEVKTPLEIQINSFVQKMAILGGIVFIIVWAINYSQSKDIIDSLIKALTLAMSILPEEIPVAFTTFMALGAWRLMKMGIIVKQMKTVETLGGATVVCIDKTGTITQNEMDLHRIFSVKSNRVVEPDNEALTSDEEFLIASSMWASEPIPFDPMEVAIHELYTQVSSIDERGNFEMIHEYPLGGRPPMMTHIFRNSASGQTIIAAKGAPAALMSVSNLSTKTQGIIERIIADLAKQGYRLLGVGVAKFQENDFPEDQTDFDFDFLGLLAFYDPPKTNMKEVLEEFDDAGVKVKIITGDNAITTNSIAKAIGFRGIDKTLSGEELMPLDDKEVSLAVREKYIFTRMFPEAKLKIINALISNDEIVGMTGDGVNDAPALKAAHIGIAMGNKGTEIAKEAATLVLADDNLGLMIDAIAMGRRIYTNLKKAIQYIISIHIPIILTVFIPLALGWKYPSILSPVHVILLELIMGPTCSIIYENEPTETNTMLQPPRKISKNFFEWSEISISLIQGLIISLGVLLIYQYSVSIDMTEGQTRAMVFTTLISANVFLTLVNRSFYYAIWTTLRYKNILVPLIISITSIILAALLFVPSLRLFFEFESLPLSNILLSIGTGCVFVIWIELYKGYKRISKPIKVHS